jgi:hypothetical protein
MGAKDGAESPGLRERDGSQIRLGLKQATLGRSLDLLSVRWTCKISSSGLTQDRAKPFDKADIRGRCC